MNLRTLTFRITFTLALSLAGASEPPDPRECEETRRELVGGHPPSFGHCQGEQHEAAETEEGGHTFENYLEIYFPTEWICLSGGADSTPGNEAEDGKARRRRSFEAFVEHSSWFRPLIDRQHP